MRMLAATLLFSTVLVACGEPRSADADKFAFDPVPYTVVPRYWCEDDTDECRFAWSIDERDCWMYETDKVLVSVALERVDEFEAQLKRWDFGIESKREVPAEPPWVTYGVSVPLGSVPDAIRFIDDRFETVHTPHKNNLGYIDTPPQPTQDCLAANPDAEH